METGNVKPAERRWCIVERGLLLEDDCVA